MKKFILAFSFAILGMMMNCLQAQNYTNVDTVDYIADKVQNWFIGGDVGASYSMGENTRFDNYIAQTRPSFRIQFGKNFYPQFGLRMTAHFLNQRGRTEWEVADYIDQYGEGSGDFSFKMAGVFLDGVFDAHNFIWGYKEKRRFSLKFYLGLGGFYTIWNEDQLAYLRQPTYKDCTTPDGVHHNAGDLMDETTFAAKNIESKDRLYFAGHVGMIFDYRLSDAWSCHIDGSFNGTDDGYNGIRYRRVYDSYVDIYAGFTYRFLDHGRNRLRYVHYTDEAFTDSLEHTIQTINDSLEEEPPLVVEQENVTYKEMLQTTVSFYIDKTFVTDAQKRNVRSVAKFLESHPDLDVVICGYADVQTAYPKYNMMLSRKRAQAVYDMLIQEFGVDPKRLTKDYKGDQEQPFAVVNEWNRAVIFQIKPHEAAVGEGDAAASQSK